MPTFLVNLLISLIVKFGLPYVLTWLHDRFPWIPIATVRPVLDELVENLKAHKEAKKETMQSAKQKMRECLGVACPVELKHD